MNLFQTLKSLDQTTHNEQVLIQFIVNNPERFLELRPNEIASEVFVSVATIYRLLDKLGYNGLAQFKIEVAASIQSHHHDSIPVDVDYPINPLDSIRDMGDNLYNIYHHTAQETREHFDYTTLMHCAKTLFDAKSVTVYTSSSNIYFARNFKFQMQEIGRHVEVPEDEFTQRIHAANSTESSAAIVMSYAGRSKILKEIISILKENQTPIILISSKHDNPLTQYADSILYLASSENHFDKISSFSSRFSLLYIFDMLYSGVSSRHYDEHIRYKKTNYQKINKELK